MFILFLGSTPIFAHAAILSISPASGTFEVGDRVTVKIMVSSNVPINAISVGASFSTSIFTIESVSKAGSLLDFWVSEPNFSQGAGTLHFEGVTLGGFKGGTATVLTATLKAAKIGSGTVIFTSGQVLANDGQGTDITSGLKGATFSVEARKDVSKPPVPEQKKPEAPQPPPTLESPEIVLTRKFGEQAISGTSNYPQAQALLTFVAESGVKIFIIGTTDDSGEFILLVPQTLKRGTYKVYAVIIQESTKSSHISNEISISIGGIFSDISYEIKILILILIIVLIYLIIRAYYYLRKNKKFRFFVRREAKEAENVVRESFKSLEEEAGGKIKKDLSEAENLITKEIKDIEKI